MTSPDRENEAAATIQSAFRHSKQPDASLSSDARWNDVLQKSQLSQLGEQSNKGYNDSSSKARWQRSIFIAKQLGGKSALDSNQPESPDPTDKNAFQLKLDKAKAFAYDKANLTPSKSHGKPLKVKKELEYQHWLELCDQHHRYGSNLKHYHEEWDRSGSNQNFFAWLDHGGGKDMSLDDCPREKLEAEQILYLSAEQRLHYLVSIDDNGLLRWTNPHVKLINEENNPNPLVDTTFGRFVDAGKGDGLIPCKDEQHLALKSDTASISSYSSDSSTDSQSSASASPKKQPDAPTKQAYIYVSDMDYNIYIGIKQRGSLQHSSFLSGAPITSAGTISVAKGVITKISPMSGHYRTKTEHFKRFIEVLKEQGADLSKVHIGKTELSLFFVSRANTIHSIKKKVGRKQRDLQAQLKNKLHLSSDK